MSQLCLQLPPVVLVGISYLLKANKYILLFDCTFSHIYEPSAAHVFIFGMVAFGIPKNALVDVAFLQFVPIMQCASPVHIVRQWDPILVFQ